MPPVVTLDDLTAMMTVNEHHRYETSPEAVLSTMPLAWVLNTNPAEHDLG